MKNKILLLISNFQNLNRKQKIIGIIIFFSLFLFIYLKKTKTNVNNNRIINNKITIVKLSENEENNLINEKEKIRKKILENYNISKIIKNFEINFNIKFPYFFINYRNFPLIKKIFNNEYKNINSFKKEILLNINKKDLCYINKNTENLEEEIDKILKFFKIYNYKIIKYFDFERNENKELKFNPKFTGLLFSYIPYLSYSFYENNKIKDFTIFCDNTGKLIKYTNYYYYNNKNNYHNIIYILKNNKISKVIENLENEDLFYKKIIIFDKENEEINKLTVFLKDKKTNEYYIDINIEILNEDILSFKYKYFYFSLLENEKIRNDNLFSELILLERKTLKDYLINNVIRIKKYLYKYKDNFYELIKKEKFDNSK